MKKHMPMIGFACIAFLFLYSGLGKFMNHEMMAAMLGKTWWPMPEVSVYLAGILELLAGAMILFRYKAAKAACALIAYVALVTVLFHIGPDQMLPFFQNLSLIGGLMLVKSIGCNSGDCSTKKSKKKDGCCGGGCAS